MKIMKLKSIVTSALLIISTIGFTQLPGGLPGGDGGGDDPDNGVPIDNGIILLVVAGAALGIRKLTKKKQ